jgi:hypothetical protein
MAKDVSAQRLGEVKIVSAQANFVEANVCMPKRMRR